MWVLWVSILASVGTSILTNLAMEAYHQRRADEQVGRFDKFTE